MKKLLVLGSTLLAALSTGCRPGDAAEVEMLSRRTPINEPYAYVSGGSLRGEAVPWSPDPLVRYVWDNPQAEDSLQIFVMQPCQAEAISGAEHFEGLQTATGSKCHIRVNGPGVIRLDFGTELPAWLEIDSPDLNGIIELGCSEHKEYSMFPKIARPVRYGSTWRMELNRELYEGVRYGFIRVNSLEHPFTITDVRAVCQVKPTNYTGRFQTDNEMLNRIWYTGAWDVKANLRQESFGAIMFDRGDRFSWTGDAYTAQAASLAAFSNYDMVLRNLHWTDSHQNGIETYELYWVESLIDYYMYSGDEAGLRNLLPRAEERLGHAWDIFDNPRGLAFVGWDLRLGTGFDNPHCTEGIRTFQMLSIGVWKHLAEVLEMIGERDKASHYRALAEMKTLQVTTPQALASLGMHASADAINADLLPDLQRLYHPDFSDRLQRQSFSSFNQCFLLRAMAHAGHYDDALASVIDHWGGQIEWGGTCFFELFRPDWCNIIEKNGPVPFSPGSSTSLAHPWGAGVTAWLSKEVLGIKPTSGGFRTFSVKPHFAGFATRVEGQTMTPHGPIRASFDLRTGHHSLSVPEGTEGKLFIPKEGMAVRAVKVNGKVMQGLQEDDSFVSLPALKPGDYDIRVKYVGHPAKKREEGEYVFATQAEVDTLTHGSGWETKYGRDGCLIVAGREDGGDLVRLPDYADSIFFDIGERRSLSHYRSTEIKPLSSDALLPISNGKDQRNAFGCYYTGQDQCLPLKIRLKGEHPYRVSVYMADCDRGGRDVNVEAFDLETGNRISPEVRIPHLEKGAYVTYQYNRSICIYAYNIHGDNAVYNAVFLDPACD